MLRATTACKFSSLLWPAGSAPATLASLLFDPPEPQIIGKHSVSRLSYLFAHLNLLSSDSFSSDLPSSNPHLLSASALLCFSSVHIVGSLTSKLPSIKAIDFSRRRAETPLWLPIRWNVGILVPNRSCNETMLDSSHADFRRKNLMPLFGIDSSLMWLVLSVASIASCRVSVGSERQSCGTLAHAFSDTFLLGGLEISANPREEISTQGVGIHVGTNMRKHRTSLQRIGIISSCGCNCFVTMMKYYKMITSEPFEAAIFTSAHLHICSSSSSSHPHIFTSSHLHIFTFSLALLLSCPLALSFLFLS